MKIYYIMGKSSSGKDTIFKYLLNDSTLNLTRLVPWTTRPIRFGENDGVDYNFRTNEEFFKMKEENLIIESREYDTKNGLWIYFTPKENLEEKTYMTIGTLESYKAMKNVYGDDLIPIYIQLEDGIRLQRALTRELTQSNPKYAEMCRRFLADCDDFSEEKLSDCNIDIRFENNDLEKCVTEIKNFISKNNQERGA